MNIPALNLFCSIGKPYTVYAHMVFLLGAVVAFVRACEGNGLGYWENDMGKMTWGK